MKFPMATIYVFCACMLVLIIAFCTTTISLESDIDQLRVERDALFLQVNLAANDGDRWERVIWNPGAPFVGIRILPASHAVTMCDSVMFKVYSTKGIAYVSVSYLTEYLDNNDLLLPSTRNIERVVVGQVPCPCTQRRK
jgi:heme/copper-type cytochrome/quinol oxidase subunit 1